MVKNIIATSGRRIVLLGQTRPGRWHDKKCIDRENWQFPAGSTVLADRGFAGYEQPRSIVTIPHRRPNKQKMSSDNRKFNRQVSRKRVVVEHVIAGIKHSRIVSSVLRTRKPQFPDKAMLIAGALHNFRTVSQLPAWQGDAES